MKLQINLEDLKCLFIACQYKGSIENFIKECEVGYNLYFQRNQNDLIKYGEPKTYSQWINGQTICLT
jgi:hypothetical protein